MLSACFATYYTLTPLHAGAGEGAGSVDRAIQREKHTGYPVVYSSGMKGGYRSAYEAHRPTPDHCDLIFGREPAGGNDQQGSGHVIFTDAKILLFPVRSSEGVFKWVVSPFVLKRLERDIKMFGEQFLRTKWGIDSPIRFDCDVQNERTAITLDTIAIQGQKIILEDFAVTLSRTESATWFTLLQQIAAPQIAAPQIAAPQIAVEELKRRVLLVSDRVFGLLVTSATQIIARNKLGEDDNAPETDNKKSSNLWFEETVPADSLFYSLMTHAFNDDTYLRSFAKWQKTQKILQFGGNETVGYGFVNAHPVLLDEPANNAERNANANG